MSTNITDNTASIGVPQRIFYFVLKVVGSLSAMVIWFLAGGVFHRSFDLFTRWNATTVNIAAVTGGFLIMTASVIIIGYIVGERKNRKIKN